MFGYVNIERDELKIREYRCFRAYYCGLCRAIGRLCSQSARLGLQYDMTFLAMLLSSLRPEKTNTEQKPCIAHPVQKRDSVIADDAVDYAAYMSVLLAYLKCRDDWQDEKSIKALIGMLLHFRAVRRAKRHYGGVYEKIKARLDRLSGYERENCSELDMVADCFAEILAILFTPDFIENPEERRILSWIGYNTGRWIYILDAVADLEKDEKQKNYNPLLAGGCLIKKTAIQELEVTLTYTLHNIAASYELLNIQKNDAILKNILYLGMKHKQDAVLNQYIEEEMHESL